MDVTFQIPDELVDSVTATGDLPRRALEAFALEELRAGRITEPQLCEMLGLARIQIDGFLKSHGILHVLHDGGFRAGTRRAEAFGVVTRCAWSSPTLGQSIT